jgi:NADH-quinone oxidoreductase subunit C
MIDTLRGLFPGASVEPAAADGQPTLRVPVEQLLETARGLHDRPELSFILLADVTAVDWWPREPRFEVVYHLASMDARLRLKVALPGDRPRLPTLQSIWPGAGWLEREVWDLFGIVFEDHGDLRRLLMPDDWAGHPLRKDYPVQIRLRPKASEPLQVTEEEFRANLARDKAARADAPQHAGGTGGAGH